MEGFAGGKTAAVTSHGRSSCCGGQDRIAFTVPDDAPLMLSAGDHQVRLMNPDLGKDVTRTVHIKPSETNTVRVLLDE